mmetsp:Transcript_32918/g.70076  ORF Transcript_32918/g.70076 Transcript_32918/m.70076 type:complete len:228 (-) Transcript_32918:2373-3056(-)
MCDTHDLPPPTVSHPHGKFKVPRLFLIVQELDHVQIVIKPSIMLAELGLIPGHNLSIDRPLECVISCKAARLSSSQASGGVGRVAIIFNEFDVLLYLLFHSLNAFHFHLMLVLLMQLPFSAVFVIVSPSSVVHLCPSRGDGDIGVLVPWFHPRANEAMLDIFDIENQPSRESVEADHTSIVLCSSHEAGGAANFITPGMTRPIANSWSTPMHLQTKAWDDCIFVSSF